MQGQITMQTIHPHSAAAVPASPAESSVVELIAQEEPKAKPVRNR